MSTARRLLTALSVWGLVALAGCGGDGSAETSDSSNEEQITRVAESYANALNSGDAEAACELEVRTEGCVQAIEMAIAEGGSFVEGFKKVTKVETDGDTAKATFTGGGFLALSDVDGEWKVGATDAEEGSNLGLPETPETKRCSPRAEQKLRDQLERSGQRVPDGPLYCGTASFQDE